MHEKSDVDAGKILRVAGIGMALVLAVLFAVDRLYRRLTPKGDRDVPTMQAVVPGRVATSREELRRLREWENRELKTYRWVHKEEGVVQIPIEPAMDLFVQRQGKP